MHIDMDAYIYESHIFGNMEVYMLKSPSIFSQIFYSIYTYMCIEKIDIKI